MPIVKVLLVLVAKVMVVMELLVNVLNVVKDNIQKVKVVVDVKTIGLVKIMKKLEKTVIANNVKGVMK